MNRLKWFFRAEKINAVVLRVIEMAMTENLINRGAAPERVVSEGITLGRSMGDLVFISLLSKFDMVIQKRHDVLKFLENLYVFLFGEKPKISILHDNDSMMSVMIEDTNGFPTCRGIVSPHHKIMFGFYLVGIIDRIFDIMKEDLSLASWVVKEAKCVAVGHDRCSIIIDLRYKEDNEVKIIGRKK